MRYLVIFFFIFHKYNSRIRCKLYLMRFTTKLFTLNWRRSSNVEYITRGRKQQSNRSMWIPLGDFFFKVYLFNWSVRNTSSCAWWLKVSFFLFTERITKLCVWRWLQKKFRIKKICKQIPASLAPWLLHVLTLKRSAFFKLWYFCFFSYVLCPCPLCIVIMFCPSLIIKWSLYNLIQETFLNMITLDHVITESIL